MYEIKVIVNPVDSTVTVDWGELDKLSAIGALQVAISNLCDGTLTEGDGQDHV